MARTALRGGWRSVRDVEPEFWLNLRDEVLAGRQWIDRVVVLAYAAATGLMVVGFTFLAEAALDAFKLLEQMGGYGRYLTLLWTPLLTVALSWWTRRYVPGAMGPGIPQVVRALDDELDASQRSWLVSLRLSLHKIGLVSGGLLAGLSIGREGPTVQVGTGVMVHARRWLSPQSGIDAHDLMVAGAAAGIAAAFNTPLGGIVIALEQLSRRRSMSQGSLVISSIAGQGAPPAAEHVAGMAGVEEEQRLAGQAGQRARNVRSLPLLKPSRRIFFPDLVRAAEPKVVRPHALDLGQQVGIAPLSRRPQLGSVPGDGR